MRWYFDDISSTNYLVKIVVVSGDFVGGEDCDGEWWFCWW
jgi:hypothetical protein